jgi:Flp pilus assembly protein TadG
VRFRGRNDEGSATLNLVVVFPVFLFLLLTIVQAALYFHARHVALAAAQEGLRSARLYDGTAAGGQERATAFLASVGNTLTSEQVLASRDAATARVEVKGAGLTLLPGLSLHIDEIASGPVERFTSP